MGKGGRRLRRRAAARAAVARAAEQVRVLRRGRAKAAAGASQDAQAERAAEKAAGKMAGEKAEPAKEPLRLRGGCGFGRGRGDSLRDSPPDAKTKELFLRNPRLAATYWRLARQRGLGPDASAAERARGGCGAHVASRPRRTPAVASRAARAS